MTQSRPAGSAALTPTLLLILDGWGLAEPVRATPHGWRRPPTWTRSTPPAPIRALRLRAGTWACLRVTWAIPRWGTLISARDALFIRT